VIDQVFWQYAEQFTDRLDARAFLDASYAKPAQVVQFGVARAGLLMPWLDELTALSAGYRSRSVYVIDCFWLID